MKNVDLQYFKYCVLSLLCSVAGFSSIVNAQVSPEQIANVLTKQAVKNRFPGHLIIPVNGENVNANVRYTFDNKIHQDMAKVYLQYKPDYACFVVIDVDTGAILNLASFIKSQEQWGNLVMRSEYPAASVFKIVTAAAALDLGKVNVNTVFPFNGKSTTLYKKQVLHHNNNKWTRKPNLVQAFAKSMNPVFARIGMRQVGKDNLLNYAHRFGFDQQLQSDFKLPVSSINLKFDDQWEMAEASSGYTTDITLSPIHAAQMAAIIANDGKMVTPYMVQSLSDKQGKLLYKAQPSDNIDQVISAQTAKNMRKVMQATVKSGSARKSFSKINRYKVYSGMEIGGKTGSLTGFSPKGRHDWFVGYAEKDGKRLAFASLIVNKEKWTVRSSYVARQFLYDYFSRL